MATGNGTNRVWMLIVILAIPVVAFLIAAAAGAKYESDWQDLLKQKYPYASAASRAAVTIQFACQQPEVSGDTLCTNIHYMALSRFLAVITALLGLGLWAGIAAAGRSAESSRERLLQLFRPGLYVTVIGLMVLIVMQAALVCSSVYFGEVAATGSFHPYFVIAAALGGLVGVASIVGGVWGCLEPLKIRVLGVSLSHGDAPQLWQFVADIARRIGTTLPRSIVVGLEDNFYVTNATIVALNGEQQGPVLYLSLPLCRVLDRDEFTSVIAHELAHFKGDDTQYSEQFLPIYRGASESLGRMVANIGKNIRSVMLIPAALILNYFLDTFTIAERKISRDRELTADRIAVQVTDDMLMASALVKIHAVGGLWNATVEHMNKEVASGRVPANVSPLFEDFALHHVFTDEVALRDLGQQQLAHPTDTHPQLADRLQAIGWTTERAVIVVQTPAASAASLVPSVETIESGLTQKWCELLQHVQQISKAMETTAPQSSARN